MATQAEMDAAWEAYQAQQSNNDAAEKAWNQYQASQTGPSTPAPAPSFQNPITDTLIKGIQNARSLPYGVAQNLADLGTGAANIGGDIINTFTQNVLPPKYQTHLPDQNTPYNFMARAPSHEGALAGEIGSAFMLPGAPGAAKIANAVSKIPKLGAEISPYVAPALTGGAYGGLYGMSNPGGSDWGSLGASMGLGALVPVGLQGLARGIGTAAAGLLEHPLNRIQKTAQQEAALNIPDRSLTPAESAINLKTAQEQGINPTLGGITNNQAANKNYEHASYLPGANQRKESGQMVGQVQKFANDIYNNLFGNIPTNQVNSSILSQVKNVFDAKKLQSKANFDNLAEAADAAGVKPVRENAQAYAAKQLADSNFKTKANVNNPLKGEKEVLDLLSTTAKPVGKKYPYSFNEIKQERTAVGELADKIRDSSPKSTTALNILDNLYKKYTQDMGDALKNSGNEALHSAWEKANQFHSTNVAPFREGNLPFIIKRGEYEKITPELLNNSKYANVIKMLPIDTRKLILGSKLMGNASELSQKMGPNGEIISETNIQPHKLGAAYKNLNIKQSPNLTNLTKNITHIINGKEEPLPIALQKLYDLNQMAEPIRKIAKEPPTGYVTKALAGNLSPAVLGALTGIASGVGGLGTAGLAAGAMGGASLAGKGATKYLRNPKILEAYTKPEQRTELVKEAYNLQNLGKALPPGLIAFLNQQIQGGQ